MRTATTTASGTFAIADGSARPQSDTVSPAREEWYGAELPSDRVLLQAGLPVPGDLPGAASSNASALTAPVQAIPTPTSFHAGGIALAALFVAGRFRRGRRPKRA